MFVVAQFIAPFTRLPVFVVAQFIAPLTRLPNEFDIIFLILQRLRHFKGEHND